MIHEATFGNEEKERARKTGHATAEEAAQTAERAGVLELVLTHLSARYSETPEHLQEQARAVFRRCRVAHDGLIVHVPLRAESLVEKALGGE